MEKVGCTLFVHVYGVNPEMSLVAQGQQALLSSFARLQSRAANDEAIKRWTVRKKPQFRQIDTALPDSFFEKIQDSRGAFADVFLKPIVPLDLGKLTSYPDTLELYVAFLRRFIFGPGVHTTLVTWRTDWASFFDEGPAGRSRCWTLHHHHKRVTALFASANGQ